MKVERSHPQEETDENLRLWVDEDAYLEWSLFTCDRGIQAHFLRCKGFFKFIKEMNVL